MNGVRGGTSSMSSTEADIFDKKQPVFFRIDFLIMLYYIYSKTESRCSSQKIIQMNDVAIEV